MASDYFNSYVAYDCLIFVLCRIGAVYAHRNEDIVNLRTSSIVKEKQSSSPKEAEKEPCPPPKERNKPNAGAAEAEAGRTEVDPHVSGPSKKRKTDHSSILAILFGMDEGELNKILLSEPPP